MEYFSVEFEMMEKPYKQALERRAEIAERIEKLRSELKELESELGQLNVFVHLWHRFSGTKLEYPMPESTKKRAAKNPPREEVGDLVEKILTERGRPMPRAPLFKEVTERGMAIYGKDPEMVFSTMLWRMRDRFIRLPKLGYWLAGQPCPPVGYDPSEKDLPS